MQINVIKWVNLFWQIVLREIIVDILDIFYNCLLEVSRCQLKSVLCYLYSYAFLCVIFDQFFDFHCGAIEGLQGQQDEELLEFFCFIFFLSSNVWGLAINVCVTYHFNCRYLLLTTYLVYTFILRVIDWWCSFGILTSYYSIWCNVQACIYMYVAYLTW